PASSVEAEMVTIGPAPPVFDAPPGWCATAGVAISANAPAQIARVMPGWAIVVSLHCLKRPRKGERDRNRNAIRQAGAARGSIRRGADTRMDAGRRMDAGATAGAAETKMQ